MKVKIKDIKRGKNDRQEDSPALEEAAIGKLAESIDSEGLLQEPVVTEQLELLAGFRRLAALERLGWTECEVRVVPGPVTETKKRVIRFTENIARADLEAAEKSLAMVGLLDLNPGWTHKELAAHVHLEQSSVTRYLAYRNGTPEVQKAYLSGEIDLTRMYAIVKLPPDKQNEALVLSLSGAKRDAIEKVGQSSRKGKSAKDEAGKTAKVHCLLPTGVQITVSGKGLSLGSAIEALTDGIREMRAAKASGYTAKTFAASMKDKARAKQEKATATDNEAKG
jgi:ParB family transcriptional regulator, chromosome partitioning protein